MRVDLILQSEIFHLFFRHIDGVVAVYHNCKLFQRLFHLLVHGEIIVKYLIIDIPVVKSSNA